MSDNVVKHGFASDYQTWETPLAGAGAVFSPFFSLTSPAQMAPKNDFSPAEVSVVSQTQAQHEDWQVFSAPHEEANFSAAVEGVFGEGEAPSMASTTHSEGYDAGYQEGYDKGFTLGQSEGEVKGIEAGRQQSQVLEDQRNQDMQLALGYLAKVTDALSDELLQPMQTLALQLAKELVRGELSLSSYAIERLIKLSMEQLQATQSTIQVHINPLEFERLQQHNGLPDQVVLQPSNDVSMGSIKVEHAGSWVEDLMEDRLAQISQQAFGFVDEAFVEPLKMIEAELETETELEAEIEPEDLQDLSAETVQQQDQEQDQEQEQEQDQDEAEAEAEAEVTEVDEQADAELVSAELEEPLEADTVLTGESDEQLKSPAQDD